MQRAALSAAGCERIFEEKISGAQRERPQLGQMLEQLRADDVVIVARLDRLARSTRDLLEIADRMTVRGAELRSLGEPWADTTSPSGKMILTVFAGIAEFERSLIKERTSAGRAHAQARGVRFGRPGKITDEQWRHYGPKLRNGTMAVPEVAALLNCNRSTVYRRLERDEVWRASSFGGEDRNDTDASAAQSHTARRFPSR